MDSTDSKAVFTEMPKKLRGRPSMFASFDSRIPTQAPELWRGSKLSGEALPDFFRRVWGAYLEFGLQSVQLRRMDPKLWAALYQHIVKYQHPWPPDLELLNLKPPLLRIISKLDAGQWRELSQADILRALRKREQDAVALRLREKRKARQKSR